MQRERRRNPSRECSNNTQSHIRLEFAGFYQLKWLWIFSPPPNAESGPKNFLQSFRSVVNEKSLIHILDTLRSNLGSCRNIKFIQILAKRIDRNCPSCFYHCEGNRWNMWLALRSYTSMGSSENPSPRWDCGSLPHSCSSSAAELLHAGAWCPHHGPAGTKILVSPALGQPSWITQGCTSTWACSGEDRQAPSSLPLSCRPRL